MRKLLTVNTRWRCAFWFTTRCIFFRKYFVNIYFPKTKNFSYHTTIVNERKPSNLINSNTLYTIMQGRTQRETGGAAGSKKIYHK